MTGFCGFNPLKDYALAELERCATDRLMSAGIKLHFGNSDVQLDDPAQVERLRTIFAAADDRGMAIVLHLRPSVNMRRP
jgi:predicted TIM-barrel fold metal-dependent hydrolase